MKDPRFYPEGRGRIYLSPAHIDLHTGRRGFFVEKLNSSPSMGYYDFDLGNEHARGIDQASYRQFVKMAKASMKDFKESCGNDICEKGLEAWAQERAMRERSFRKCR